MDDFDKKVERLTALKDSVQSYHLCLSRQAVKDLTTKVYRRKGDAFQDLVDSLTFEVQPFVNLIDRQSLHSGDRAAVWAGFGDHYLARLVVVNSDHSSSNDYDAYLASLSTERIVAQSRVVHSDHSSSSDYDEYLASLSSGQNVAQSRSPKVCLRRFALPQQPAQDVDRPLSTPSLGTLSVWVTHVVWDDMSIAFAVEYGGFFRGTGDERVVVSQKPEENLHVLVGTCDRSRSAEEIGADLIRR